MDAAVYDNWYETPRGQWTGRREFALLLKALDPRPGESLLDVGCGTGWFTRKFAGELHLQVTGLDIDFSRLTFARSRDARASYLQADACRLPFGDRQFDQVVSITALPFVADWPRALSEIVRVTRGRFALGLLNRDSLLWRQKGQGEGSGAYRGAHWHTAKEVSSVLATLPVSAVRVQSAIFMPSGLPHARLLERIVPATCQWGAFLLVSGQRGH